MQIDDCRKAFEVWATSKKLPLNISSHFINEGAYIHPDTHVAWLAYQAAWNIRAPERESQYRTDEKKNAPRMTRNNFDPETVLKLLRDDKITSKKEANRLLEEACQAMRIMRDKSNEAHHYVGKAFSAWSGEMPIGDDMEYQIAESRRNETGGTDIEELLPE